MDYLQADKKTGRLSYRRVYPPELRAHIPRPNVELKRSLGTKCITEPGATDRYQSAAADYDRTVARARKLAARSFDALDAPTIARLAKTFEREQAEWIEKNRLTDDAAEFAEKALHGIWVMESEYLQWRVDNDLDAMMTHWGRYADALLYEAGIVIDPADHEILGRLCRALNDSAIAIRPEQRARIRGEVIPIPELPSPPARPNGKDGEVSAPVTSSFEDIAEKVLESPTQNIGASTKQATRTALRSFREAHGTLPPSKITKALVTEWLDLLALRPKKPDAAHRKLPLRELVALYEGKDVERLATKTRAQHLGALGAIWNKAQREEGRISDGIPNPFVGRKSLATVRLEEPQELSKAELTAIFSLPIFSNGERPGRGKGEAAYWLPLMLLWTGARPEELAQLMVSDVFQDGDGRWLLRITDEGIHPHKGKRTLKTAKKASGRRTFPIPKALLDLNFIAYVESIRKSGETALFPLLRTKGERKELFAGWGEWWSLYLRENKVLPPGGGRRPAREFRHNWTTAARTCGIPEDAREYIQGHRRPGASANEGYGSRSPLGQHIDKLSFAGVDFSQVNPWVEPQAA